MRAERLFLPVYEAHPVTGIKDRIELELIRLHLAHRSLLLPG